MKKLIAGIFCGLLLVSLQLAAARRGGSFDFKDEAVAADVARQAAANQLLKLISLALSIKLVVGTRITQMSPQEIKAWQTSVVNASDGGSAVLSGCFMQSDCFISWFSSKLTPDLLAVIAMPLHDEKTALDMAVEAGNEVLAKVIRVKIRKTPIKRSCL